MEREISIILKVKGAEAAKKAVENVFNQQTTTLVKGFNQATQKTGTNMQRVSRTSKQASTSMNTFTKTLGRGMAALYLYNRAWNVFGTQFEEGMQLQRASDQFALNVGNVNKMLPELRSATRGVVADFDLLKTAGRAFQQGLKPEQMSGAFKMGTIAAQRLGLSATDAINTITNAITKQDEGALNTLGIVTNVNQAYKTQAALIAKSGGVMSKAMSIQLRQSLILKELQKRFGGTNEVQADGLQVLERFRASWKNFRAELGQTIGIALIPLARALTAVLDTTTRLLDKMNDTGGFQKFVQLAATLAGIWGTMKFITGARTLLTLFGVIGQGKVSKGIASVGAAASKVSGIFSILGKNVSKFVLALSFIAPRVASVLSSIPGWGTAIAAATILFKPFITMLQKAWVAGKVFFQLLSNFDENTGLSKVLKKDADELGSMYNLIENVAKISLEVWAVLRGVGRGIGEAFSPISGILGFVTDQIEDFAGWLVSVDKIAVRSSSRLDAITERWRKWAQYIGLAASGIALLVPGLQTVGALGVAGFGGAIINDALGLNTKPQPAQQTQESPQSPLDKWRSSFQPQASTQMSLSQAIPTETQASTQQSTPAPRAMNMDYSDDWTEILRKNNKLLEKQNSMMEQDSQKQEVRESQRSAQDKVWTRR